MTTPVGRERRGKAETAKDVPLLMAFHGAAYVATANVAFLDDYAAKLERALAVEEGLAYLHLYSPCHVGWGAPMDSGLTIARRAVETRVFPLWEADHGRFRLTHPVRHPRPLAEFTGLMERFRHLKDAELETLRRSVEARYRRIETLCAALGDV
ncbi:MAG: hypothetical protein HYV94_00685 [Candidatus Rokubacteria bacterium]|nr:hypothetical protein [Candidatus Rokubacteria bacterium]